MTSFQAIPLSELSEKITKGSSPKWQGVGYVDKPGVLFVTSENVGENELVLTKRKYVEEKFNIKDKKSVLKKGDVLTNIVGASIGRTAVYDIGEEANINQAVCMIRCRSDLLLKRYLSYLLNSPFFLEKLSSGKSDMARANLSLTFFRKLEIPHPPLEEQKRIVAVLDEAFKGLDRARNHIQTNLQNARELFAQSVDALFAQLGSEEISEMRLGSIVSRLTNGYVGPTRNIYVDKGVPYLLARLVKNNRLRFDGKTYITPEFNFNNKKSTLKAGDVVLVQSGHIGHCAVIPPEHNGHNCHAMIVLSAIPEILSGDYLSAVLNAPAQQDHFQKIRTGSTVPHLTCKLVKEMKLPVPKLELQTEIVDQIEKLRNKLDNLDAIYRSKLQDLDDLRQSHLQKAFAGELT